MKAWLGPTPKPVEAARERDRLPAGKAAAGNSTSFCGAGEFI